jgi:hypothetical protein
MDWARNKGAPGLGSRRFRKLLGMVCIELGLQIDGEGVAGLRLIAERND